jgi:hypothetical protein
MTRLKFSFTAATELADGSLAYPSLHYAGVDYNVQRDKETGTWSCECWLFQKRLSRGTGGICSHVRDAVKRKGV